jgi:hypothetical protein
MKWHAVKEKSGAYEIRRTGGEVFGGIIIDGKNRGIGFVGSIENNQYIFEFEEGVFSKIVKIYAGGADKNNQIGTIKLGFMDSGTLETTASAHYDWKSTGSSKIWTNEEKNAVMFLDLENETEKPVAVLSSENLDDKSREILLLSGWYLLVVEYRAGFTNSKLAGMPVKTEEFSKATKQPAEYGEWWETLIDAVVS